MHFGIAIWGFCWQLDPLPEWIGYFADNGFDTISLHPGQFTEATPAQMTAVNRALDARDLAATVHGSVAMEPALAEKMVRLAGPRLAAFTMDSAMAEDSRGRSHDCTRIAAALRHLQKLTDGTRARLAVEDFPLDAAAQKHGKKALDGVYGHPRTGILVDVGHMHMRMTQADYFRGLTVADYLDRLPVPLVELHLHDNHGDKDEHGHFGLGTVPFAEVAAWAKGRKYDGECTIEIAPSFHGSTPDESRPLAVESLGRWKELLEG